MAEKQIPAAPQFTIPEWLAPHIEEVAGWGPVGGEDTACWVTGCERSPYLHGLCRRHYFRATGSWKRPKRQRSQSPVVVPAHDSVTASPQPSESTRRGGRGESTREPREVQGDATECAS